MSAGQSQGAHRATRYFLGVDVGATKSHALIADETGRAIGFGEAGPGNPEMIGWHVFRETLHTATHRALASAAIGIEQLCAAGIGLGGYDWPEDREPALAAAATLGLNGPCEIVNDAIIGLLAGASAGWGVVVVSGTGSNCRGRGSPLGADGREGRVTGEGHRFAEYAGAADLVRKAVQAVSLAWSLRGPATLLSAMFMAESGAADVTDLLAGLARNRYQLTARHAPLVFQAAASGDHVAQEIIRWAGQELGSQAVGVIRQLGFEQETFEVVLVGSLHKGGSALAEAMKETIQAVAPGATLVRLHAPPVVGGVLLAMEQAQVETGPLRAALIDSTHALLQRAQSA